MASVTEPPQSKTPPQPAPRADELRVDEQIGRTRRALKLVDFTAGLITLAIGILVFLLATSALEHWVIPGGWSAAARTGLFGTLLLGIGWYSWRTFWPLLRQSINPAYAALAIEQNSPSLKNSLLNFLLLRNRKHHLSSQVYQAIEQQAAQRLSQVKLDSVVDRSAILRLGYVLAAITALCAVYWFLSPKDLISSAGRTLLPWSSIAAPSRVQILNVAPGDTKTARGDQLRITAEVLGLDEDEPVRLFYSTVDEQIVGQKIPMSTSAGGSEFQCQLPARRGVGSRIAGGSGGGIQQDFFYWIEAGDARTPRYQVSVFARPTLVVNRLRYEYPAYTGYPSRDVEHTGDIRAVEGTRVTLFAQANKPIKSAHVDFEADGRRDLLMNNADQQATVTFPLTLRDDRRTPRYRSYVLRYLTSAGNQNQQPPKYQIDVQPDYSPEIQLLLPEAALLEVELNQEVEFEMEARDPDFALSQVLLIGKVGEKELLQEALLEDNHEGRFVGKCRKTPQEMGLQVGDVLEYWGAAADNRRPEANWAYSAHRKLRVIGPRQGNPEGGKNQDGEGRRQPGEGGAPEKGEGGAEGQSGGTEQGNAGEGESGTDGEGSSGQNSDDPGDDGQQQGQAGAGDSADGEQSGTEQSGTGNSQGNSPSDSPDGDSENGDSENGESQPRGDDPAESGGDESAGGEGNDQGKVSSDGDDDGKAFERMAEHFKEQQSGEGDDPSGAGQAGEGDDPDSQAESDQSAADGSPDADQAGDDRAATAESGEAGSEENKDDPAGDQAAEKAGQQQDRQSDESGASGQPAAGEEQQQSDGEESQQEDGESADGQMSPEQGEAGGGDSGGQQQSAPNPDGAKSPQEKSGDPSDAAEQEDSQAPSEGRDQTESDSEGGQEGDRSGGGKQGAGQQAEEAGKGGAGENEAADDGAGQAAEPGEGEAGEPNGPDDGDDDGADDGAGSKEKAAGETGESSGDQAGEGSESAPQEGQKPGDAAQGGDQGKAGGEPGEAQPNEDSQQQPGEKSPNEQQQPDEQRAPPSDSDPADAQSQAGNPSGTGGSPSAPPPGGELEPGDAANLDYARKQTDLILNRLDDQLKKQEVDKSLLEKLGWSQDELRRFVDRWKSLQSAATDQAGSALVNDELNDALRSLGLRRNGRTGFRSKINKDKLRDLQDSFRGQVPLEFQEQVRSYIKGTATAQENE